MLYQNFKHNLAFAIFLACFALGQVVLSLPILAQGIAGRNEREDVKRKKEEKAARKKLQAAREVLCKIFGAYHVHLSTRP